MALSRTAAVVDQQAWFLGSVLAQAPAWLKEGFTGCHRFLDLSAMRNLSIQVFLEQASGLLPNSRNGYPM